MKVLVIIPAYNESASIENTVRKLQNDVPEADYIVINDCSKDNTLEILKNSEFSYLSLPVNLGIGGAVQSGYRYALNHNYDIAVQLDGDGQHDSAFLRDLLDPIIKGEADITIGSRFIEKKGFQSSGIRRLGIRLLNGMLRFTTGKKITDCTSGFRAVNRKFMALYAAQYPMDYPEPEAIVYASVHGARIKEIPVIMQERTAGESSIRPFHSGYYMMKVSLAILLCRLTYLNRRVNE